MIELQQLSNKNYPPFDKLWLIAKSFFYRTPLVTASEFKSNISNANFDKNKKRLYLYFDNGHANQTNTTKKIRFFHMFWTSTRIQRKLVSRNVALNAYNRAIV